MLIHTVAPGETLASIAAAYNLTASYLDFLPYTKTQLYLPYIGIVDVSTDDIMDKSMAIKYHVDILTGGCIAYIIIGGIICLIFNI